jgi:putative PIN family toxin of toxin-antitoxin system
MRYYQSMRLVLDTDVMVAAIRSDAGASRWLVRSVLEAQQLVTMLVSVPLLVEYEAVMTRAEHLRAARVSAADDNVLLDALADTAEPVRLAYLWRPMLGDVDDDMVLETAVNGRADALVTFNQRHFRPYAMQFGIAALPPGDVVSRLEMRR